MSRLRRTAERVVGQLVKDGRIMRGCVITSDDDPNEVVIEAVMNDKIENLTVIDVMHGLGQMLADSDEDQ